ncbi:MAG: MucB/RseB C-terminal domain-containing protein [Burkholderiales bacterium]|nr:MucB/RseB C-terminal domain-containing protein [Burkholderiales bacterium]
MRFGALAAVGAALAVALPVRADSLPQADALEWLTRITTAARQMNYAGTFVYQHGESVETSKIVHLADGGVEYEKLEVLDGPPREVLRTNDQLTTFYPDIRLIRSEKRKGRRSFPALLPEQITNITDHYEVRKADVERIAGFDAQVLVLEPKDGLRYGHKFWADMATGLLVKAKMMGDRHQAIEQFTFTQLAIGGRIGRDDVRSRYESSSAEWRTDRSDAKPAESGWTIRNVPPGFRKVMEMRRSKQGVDGPGLIHIVFSDGLAAVSVFIEPTSARMRLSEGLTVQGAFHIFTRIVGDHRVTVLGETPAVTVTQIAQSVTPKR